MDKELDVSFEWVDHNSVGFTCVCNRSIVIDTEELKECRFCGRKYRLKQSTTLYEVVDGQKRWRVTFFDSFETTCEMDIEADFVRLGDAFGELRINGLKVDLGFNILRIEVIDE